MIASEIKIEDLIAAASKAIDTKNKVAPTNKASDAIRVVGKAIREFIPEELLPKKGYFIEGNGDDLFMRMWDRRVPMSVEQNSITVKLGTMRRKRVQKASPYAASQMIISGVDVDNELKDKTLQDIIQLSECAVSNFFAIRTTERTIYKDMLKKYNITHDDAEAIAKIVINISERDKKKAAEEMRSKKQ